MSAQVCKHIRYLRRAACICAGIALAACCALSHSDAYGITAAEKQAEADAVYAQIDSLQTNLNRVMRQYDKAQSAYDEAIEKRDEAAAQIERKTARIAELQDELSDFAVGMYKQGGAGTFLDVLLEANTFEQFVTTWDACSSISNQGVDMIHETEQARSDLEEAKATFEKQSKRAESAMETADKKKQEIEDTQAALRIEAEKLSAEAAELQAQEEAEAEAARQAEEARRIREEQLANAVKAQAAAQEQEQQSGEADSDEFTDIDTEADDTVVVGSGFFANPCPTATESSGFGYRDFDNSFHKGLDMAAPEGTPYYAAESGTVMYATNDGGYNGGAGNWVVIAHGNGIVTKYMHSSATYVQPGDFVQRGQNIGAVVNTGNSFGAHLHFQVEIDGVAVNPLNYI